MRFPFNLSTDGPGKRHRNKEHKSNRKAGADILFFIQAVGFLFTKTIGFFIQFCVFSISLFFEMHFVNAGDVVCSHLFFFSLYGHPSVDKINGKLEKRENRPADSSTLASGAGALIL